METVAYHGEMDVKSRDVSYRKWKSGEIKLWWQLLHLGWELIKEILGM